MGFTIIMMSHYLKNVYVYSQWSALHHVLGGLFHPRGSVKELRGKLWFNKVILPQNIQKCTIYLNFVPFINNLLVNDLTLRLDLPAIRSTVHAILPHLNEWKLLPHLNEWKLPCHKPPFLSNLAALHYYSMIFAVFQLQGHLY